MAASLIKLSWQDHVSLSEDDGSATVHGPTSRLKLPSPCPAVLAALQRLAPPGETEEKLEAIILADGNSESLARWFFHIGQLHRRGLIRRELHSDCGRFATLSPLLVQPPPAHGRPSSHSDSKRPASGGAGHPDKGDLVCRLSRFAYLRAEANEMVLESPLSHSRVVLHDPRAAVVVAALSTASTVADLIPRIPFVPPETVSGLVLLLEEARMLEFAEPDGDLESRRSLESWEFHDLLFHSRSRRGRSDAEFGATYRLPEQPPPEALHPIHDGDGIDLFRPDLARLEHEDPPYALVQNKRRSIRKYAAQPISVDQLGEILYRVGRVTETWKSEACAPSMPVAMEFASRPYPSGGALYELAFYPVIRACSGLEGGIYFYDPLQHRLHHVSGKTPDVEALLDDAAFSTGIDPASVQVLLVLASRFRRIAWKYESIAYALTLKHVGVVYQTLYLAATAMSLAPCAVGCGDSDLFARAAGTDYHVESSVGEFLLGSVE